MDIEGIMLSEINQTEKDKYCTVKLISRNLKKKKKYVTPQYNSLYTEKEQETILTLKSKAPKYMKQKLTIEGRNKQ